MARDMCGKFLACFVAVALCALPCGTALAQTTASAATRPLDLPAHEVSRAVAQKIRVLGVGNFGQVTPTLFRGAQPTHRGFESLAKLGIAIVVDLRDGSEGKGEEKEVSALGMKFVGIPWRCVSPKDADFAKFLAVLEDNPNKKIFVHCHMGIDRTGMMIASYRMAAQGWSAAEALREMQAFGFSRFHQMVCSGLDSYEQRFPTVVSSSPAFETLRAAQDKPASPISPKP